MGNIAKKLTELIGNTPLLEIGKYSEKHNLSKSLIVKIEAFNPSGSVKARAALAMIEDAENKGVLKQGGVIIEPTSGNTGVALAMTAAIKGYRLILTMPETMSIERRNLLKAYGAELVLTEGTKGMNGAVAKAEELKNITPGAVILQQFKNPANPAIHEKTTGEEIWKDTNGNIDAFVAGVGTGGTVSGVGRTLKKYNKAIHIVAVEPASSPILEGGKPGGHKIQGIGANFIPDNYDASVTDEVLSVTDEEAKNATKELALSEGLLVGISSGAAVAAAVKLAQQPSFKDKTIVVLLPDTGERYLSTGLFS